MFSAFGKGLGFIFLVGLTTVGVLSAIFPRGSKKVASVVYNLEENQQSQSINRTIHD